jgi:hypothetical protein
MAYTLTIYTSKSTGKGQVQPNCSWGATRHRGNVLEVQGLLRRLRTGERAVRGVPRCEWPGPAVTPNTSQRLDIDLQGRGSTRNIDPMTVRPPSADVPLPSLVTKCRLALEQEARDLKAALDKYADISPTNGNLFSDDVATATHADRRVQEGQLSILALGHYQARLTYVNAFDHLSSMARLLGSDGAMSLYAHTTLSRSVAEASVRHAWLLDPSISYEERITRYAVVTYYGAENKLKGAKQSLVRAPQQIRDSLTSKASTELDQVRALINQAGMDFVLDKKGRNVARIKLSGSGVSTPIKFETGPLMEELLGESPGWYLLSSGVSHSGPWVLHSAVVGDRTGPELSLTPDLLEVATASQTAISASELVLERHANYFGFDPEPYTRKSRQRRMMLDTLMREQFVSQAVSPDPLIRAESLAHPLPRRVAAPPLARGKVVARVCTSGRDDER